MWGVLINDIVVVWQRENKASAKDGEGAGRGPCGLRICLEHPLLIEREAYEHVNDVCNKACECCRLHEF